MKTMWDFFPDVNHSIKPVAFRWIMNKMADHIIHRKQSTLSGLTFQFLNQWQRLLMRFYRA